MIPKAWREYFDPELRERKQRAAAAAAELEARKVQAEMAADRSAVGSHPIIQEYRLELLAWGEALMPGNEMDAAACYWFRRGLERAVTVLDDKVATEESTNV